MTAPLNKTPILFAALLTVATPAFAGDWRTIPGGVGNDGVCTLYNQNFECMDAARTFSLLLEIRQCHTSGKWAKSCTRPLRTCRK